ncbi:MAG: hypothetical protein AAF889_13465 [Cyanobacteria bacterium P01_D01_bin.73]
MGSLLGCLLGRWSFLGGSEDRGADLRAELDGVFADEALGLQETEGVFASIVDSVGLQCNPVY